MYGSTNLEFDRFYISTNIKIGRCKVRLIRNSTDFRGLDISNLTDIKVDKCQVRQIYRLVEVSIGRGIWVPHTLFVLI